MTDILVFLGIVGLLYVLGSKRIMNRVWLGRWGPWLLMAVIVIVVFVATMNGRAQNENVENLLKVVQYA